MTKGRVSHVSNNNHTSTNNYNGLFCQHLSSDNDNGIDIPNTLLITLINIDWTSSNNPQSSPKSSTKSPPPTTQFKISIPSSQNSYPLHPNCTHPFEGRWTCTKSEEDKKKPM